MRWPVFLLCGLLVSCKSEPPPPSDAPRVVTTLSASPAPAPSPAAPPASASASARAPRPRAPLREQEFSLPRGKTQIVGTLKIASPGAPLFVFLHRLGGDSSDWKALVQRLEKEGPEASLLLLDQRGHGRSSPADGGHVGGAIDARDIEAMAADVVAALPDVDRRLERKVDRVVLLGADLGATVAVLAASREPRIQGLALLAPVATLRGVSIYAPFASVRKLPTFIFSNKGDTISSEPATAMGGMASPSITLKLHEGQGHDLRSAPAPLWGELIAWLDGSFGSPAPAPAASAPVAASASAAPAASAPAASASASAKKAPAAPPPTRKK